MVHDLHHLDVRVRARWSTAPRRCCCATRGPAAARSSGSDSSTSPRELGVETVLLDRGLDLEQLARDAVARGADCLGMAGGDGSQALVASIAIEHGLPFVCVSAGTRNHFALDLGLNRDDPRESMQAFRDAVERTRRLRDRERAAVREQRVARRVRPDRAGGVVPRREGRDDEDPAPGDARAASRSRSTSSSRHPSGEDVDGAILVMVSNNPYVIGASPDNAQRRHLDSGKLGVFAVTTSTGAEAARLFAATALGQRRRSRVLARVHDDVVRSAITLGRRVRRRRRRGAPPPHPAPLRDPPAWPDAARTRGQHRNRGTTPRPRRRNRRPRDRRGRPRTATAELTRSCRMGVQDQREDGRSRREVISRVESWGVGAGSRSSRPDRGLVGIERGSAGGARTHPLRSYGGEPVHVPARFGGGDGRRSGGRADDGLAGAGVR